MKNMRILLDTNVLLNFITDREDPFLKDCNELMERCAKGQFQGYMAFHSLSTIWCVIKRQKSEEEARFWLNRICNLLTIAVSTQNQVKDAIENTAFSDFEDCLQDECAKNVEVDYLVTCNYKDFKNAKCSVVTPEKMISILNSES